MNKQFFIVSLLASTIVVKADTSAGSNTLASATDSLNLTTTSLEATRVASAAFLESELVYYNNLEQEQRLQEQLIKERYTKLIELLFADHTRLQALLRTNIAHICDGKEKLIEKIKKLHELVKHNSDTYQKHRKDLADAIAKVHDIKLDQKLQERSAQQTQKVDQLTKEQQKATVDAEQKAKVAIENLVLDLLIEHKIKVKGTYKAWVQAEKKRRKAEQAKPAKLTEQTQEKEDANNDKEQSVTKDQSQPLEQVIKNEKASAPSQQKQENAGLDGLS